MPLDTASAAFLDAIRASGGKPLYEQAIEEARAQVRGASLQLAAPAEELYAVVDRTIAGGDGEIAIRIYTPRPLGADESLPVVVHYHGAGFVAGDLDTHDAVARHYARHADAIVIAVDYRLAPEHPFPAAVDDAFAALEWAVAHASEYGGDPGRVAVTGDSAGGNLAAVVCLLARDRGGPRVAFQALVYPWVDLDLQARYASRQEFGGGDYFLSLRDMEWFRSQYLGSGPHDARDPRVSPLAHSDFAGLPPAVIVASGCDPLRDEAELYADRLRAAGVPVEYRCFEGTIHACTSFAAAIPAGVEVLSFVAARLHAGLARA